MKKIVMETESLCPECLKVIKAEYIEENGKIYLRKKCTEHGEYKVLAWSDAEGYVKWMKQSVHAVKNSDKAPISKGCPFDCGFCRQHEGKTCTAVLEVTYRCNMNCEICFADTEKNSYEPDLDKIRRMYEVAYKHGGDCSIQISGGEPTVREDISEIIRMGKDMGFSHIQVNTNGIRLANEPDYAFMLKEAGADLIYLQFDSLRDEVYKVIRGREMLDIKLKAIENCSKAGLGVMLVPVMVNGVNNQEIGNLIRFAKSKMPYVKGVHFQPVSYFGRYPERDGKTAWGHMNLADVVRELVIQTDGEISEEALVPRKKYDAHCAFSGAFYLDEDGVLRAMTDSRQNEDVSADTDFSVKTNTFTNRFWRLSQDKSDGTDEKKATGKDMLRFMKRLRDYTLTVSGMGFQDVFNIDLKRLKGCCVQVISNDEKAIPLCAFHLTSVNGERLYKNE